MNTSFSTVVNQKNSHPKVLVVHPGQQHSYRLAYALQQEGCLYKYITTVYYRPYTWTWLIAHFLHGSAKKKACNRHTTSLQNQNIKQIGEIGGLCLLLLQRLCPNSWLYRKFLFFQCFWFERQVARYAIKHHVDAVIAYNTNASILFPLLQKKAPYIRRILDMAAASRIYRRTIYQQDAMLAPAFAQRLHTEDPFVWDDQFLSQRKIEISHTQHFLVPSNFVKKSLKFSGVQEAQMLLCPYGVDTTEFALKLHTAQPGSPLRFIYVGGVKELKGIYYLLEAFKRIAPNQATLTVVGAVNLQDEDVQPYLKQVHFTGMVLHSEISALLRQADVFVFPSLGDSFALSCAEAAACGLPLVVSENTGFQDLMTSGQEGFVIPIQSIDAIVEKVNWFIEHPDQIKLMGRAARQLAEKYTWEAYYERMGSLIQGIFK